MPYLAFLCIIIPFACLCEYLPYVIVQISMSVRTLDTQILHLMVLAACIANARIQMVIIFANALGYTKAMEKVKKGVINTNFHHMLLLP